MRDSSQIRTFEGLPGQPQHAVQEIEAEIERLQKSDREKAAQADAERQRQAQIANLRAQKAEIERAAREKALREQMEALRQEYVSRKEGCEAEFVAINEAFVDLFERFYQNENEYSNLERMRNQASAIASKELNYPPGKIHQQFPGLGVRVFHVERWVECESYRLTQAWNEKFGGYHRHNKTRMGV